MFTVELVTYKGVYRTVTAQSINLPTPEGRRGILPNHMPIMLPISIGVVSILEESGRKRYTCSEGVFYFENNKGTLLADSIEDVDAIDINRAKAAEAKAREKIRNSDNDLDIDKAQIALLKAINRIKAKESDY
ncbi:MAG: ATP synthase F1 subunit epsilon [Erysipelotrichaceae bacterium]|nr:ATP synthase F1 subunit epsilon [Erysipelotrichaceae bacterium]MBQ1522453.1 ATP synthase F1 subunit epsilon [Erysipelotrichaceae bacterium]